MKILVSGANGNLAGAVIHNLQSTLPDMKDLAVGTRNPESNFAHQLAAAGVSVRQLDFMDADSVRNAFTGMDRVMMISTYDLNEIRIQQHRTAIDAAISTGVRHIVYTSFINAVPESDFEHNSQVHAPTEAMLRESGLEYTLLRHNLYAEFLLMDLKETLATGRLQRGGGTAAVSFIGRDDLGVSAARVLAGDGHANRIYTETGPAAVTYPEAAAIMSEVFDRPVEHIDISPEQWYEKCLAMGFPEPMARASMTNVIATLNGEFSNVSPDYQEVTGSPARSLRQLLMDNKDRYLRMFAG